ncbi:MAG: (2Fe-2S)-binding protein [Candidatus Promineifilaceae bacterium]|nr:(2Fe-2S)-binding protein [Candidatus Promineifilaceae bacterium]
MRIEKSHPKLPAVQRGNPVRILVDGRLLTAYAGESIAAVLIAEDKLGYRYPEGEGQEALPGFFCGMGICYGCLVLVDGRLRRACLTAVAEGMEVRREE